MINQLNEHLVHIKAALRRKKKWNSQLADYKDELNAIERNISSLEQQLVDEKADVKKLEGISMTNLFSTLLGKKDEKLLKEKEEVVAVQLKLEEARKNKNEVQAAIDELQQHLEKVQNIEEEYQKALKMKVELIKQKDADYADELYHLSEQEGDLEQHLVEIDEAITAGKSAKEALLEAQRQLGSAENWGLFDMFGGGLISTAIKHGHIDDATKSIQRAQTKMRTFQKELLDVNEEADLHINMSSLLTFADYFFDGIITDWMVQSRIKDSLSNVNDVLQSVDDITTKLINEKNIKTSKLEQIKTKRKSLIESY
ncbi:hypothetical protein ACLIA0_05865 [Bacillaceae bacterium W0354]